MFKSAGTLLVLVGLGFACRWRWELAPKKVVRMSAMRRGNATHAAASTSLGYPRRHHSHLLLLLLEKAVIVTLMESHKNKVWMSI
jgi:hypothetical protein